MVGGAWWVVHGGWCGGARRMQRMFYGFLNEGAMKRERESSLGEGVIGDEGEGGAGGWKQEAGGSQRPALHWPMAHGTCRTCGACRTHAGAPGPGPVARCPPMIRRFMWGRSLIASRSLLLTVLLSTSYSRGSRRRRCTRVRPIGARVGQHPRTEPIFGKTAARPNGFQIAHHNGL